MAVLLYEQIGRWEHSHQVHSVDIKDWKMVVTMKKYDEKLFLKIEGPDGAEVRACVERAMQRGLIASVVAGFVGGGLAAALVAFEAVAKPDLINCLGSSFNATIETKGDWVYWTL